MRSVVRCLACALSVLAVLFLNAQAQTRANSVEGIVINAEDGTPISGASIEAAPIQPSGSRHVTVAGIDGRFLIKNLPPGRWALTASRDAVRDGRGGRGNAPQPSTSDFERASTVRTEVTVAGGEDIRNIQLQVIAVKTAAVSGRIFDEDSRPLSAAFVKLLKFGYDGDGYAMLRSEQTSKTDSGGTYILKDVPPGDYYVSVDLTTDAISIAMYYPGVFSPSQATVIHVSSGEISGIDLQLKSSKTFTLRMTLKVQDPGIKFSDQALVGLRTRGSIRPEFFWVPTFRKEDNVYETPSIPAGEYIVYFANHQQVPLDIDRDVDLGVVELLSMPITGRVTNGNGSPLSVSGINFEPLPLDQGNPAAAKMLPGGTFSASLAPGHYQFVVKIDKESYVASANYEGREILGSGLTVSGGPVRDLTFVIEHGMATVTGTVLNSRNASNADAHVILIPKGNLHGNPAFSYQGTTDQNGTFLITGVHPGDYGVIALQNDFPANAFRNAEWQSQYEPRATQLTARSGVTTSVLDVWAIANTN